jgi:50S ribosomal subunit-associated GTPase HflX
VDLSNPQFEDQMAAVDRILDDLELRHKETVLVFNKTDLLDPEYVSNQVKRYRGVAICALSSKTLEPLILELQDHVEALLEQDFVGKPPLLPGTGEESDESSLENKEAKPADSAWLPEEEV